MPTPPYVTSADVQDTDLSEKIGQSNWTDPDDIDDRIQEGSAVIQGCLAKLGYPVDFTTIANTPLFVREMAKLYARAACWRDLFHRAPSADADGVAEKMFERFDAELDKLKDGERELIDVGTGLVIAATPVDQTVYVNTANVRRSLTMDEPENQSSDSCRYSNEEVLGPPHQKDCPCHICC
ncbi:MAG: hypothetical protein V3T23_03990 [Nitrososphaerales archaeon]